MKYIDKGMALIYALFILLLLSLVLTSDQVHAQPMVLENQMVALKGKLIVSEYTDNLTGKKTKYYAFVIKKPIIIHSDEKERNVKVNGKMQLFFNSMRQQIEFLQTEGLTVKAVGKIAYNFESTSKDLPAAMFFLDEWIQEVD